MSPSPHFTNSHIGRDEPLVHERIGLLPPVYAAETKATRRHATR